MRHLALAPRLRQAPCPKILRRLKIRDQPTEGGKQNHSAEADRAERVEDIHHLERNRSRIVELPCHIPGKLVSIDGVQLQELDFVDGELISPPGVVPVVIKSLLFS